MDWDDLQFLLAAVDGGGEVRPLDRRRITALETALNCKLVSWNVDRITLTASGQRAVDAARVVATQLSELASELGGEHGELAGRLCVASTAGFAPRAMQAFALIRDQYPALAVDVLVSSHVVDLKQKEADLAVRFFRDQQQGLAMYKLGTMGWSLYASKQYLADHAEDARKVIAYDKTFSNTAGGRWIAANVKDDAIGMRVGGIRPALDAAAIHRGMCVVPCYLAAEHDVVRVTDEVLTTNDAYAVYLAERSKEARLRVVIDALVDLFVREQVPFSGAISPA